MDGGGVIFEVIFVEFVEVEVVSAVGNERGSVEGLLRGGEDGESGREGKGFLHAGEEDIDTQVIKVDGHG